jgi:hypothetical protein
MAEIPGTRRIIQATGRSAYPADQGGVHPRRTIQPARGTWTVRKVRGPILDQLYM